MQRGPGDVFDAFHQLDQPVSVVVEHGRKPDTAVAHHDGRDAVPTGRGKRGIPGGLTVVVSVDIDEPGGEYQPIGIDGAQRRSRHRSNFGDHSPADGDVCGSRWSARAIYQGGAANDEVVFSHRKDSVQRVGERPAGEWRPMISQTTEGRLHKPSPAGRSTHPSNLFCMRLVTWNLNGLEDANIDDRTEAAVFTMILGARLDQLHAGMSAELPPDVIVLQEVTKRMFAASIARHLPAGGYSVIPVEAPDREVFEVMAFRNSLRFVDYNLTPLVSSNYGRLLHTLDLVTETGRW